MAAKTSRRQTQNSPQTSHSQDAVSLQVSLPQMLDLALGTPEVGVVNLNILHNFLHVLLHQINLRTTKVEYRGDEANRIKAVMNSSKAGPSLQLHEYSITDSSSKTIQRTHSNEMRLNADVYTNGEDAGKSGKSEKSAVSAPVTARGAKNGEGGNGVPAAKTTKGSKHQIVNGVDGERQSVIFVEPVLDGVAPTALGFKRLEETINKLQQRFEALDELANNPEMIERVKSNKNDPLSDMWHVININKRLDGCEEAIEKITTMLQDLIKSDKMEIIGGGSSEETDRLHERIVELENNFVYLSGDVANLRSIEKADDQIIAKEDSVRHAPSITIVEDAKISADKSESPKVSSIDKDQDPTTKETSKGEASDGKSSSADHETLKDSVPKKKASTQPGRRSVIGGVDLTELKNDVSMLKSEMTNLQQNLQDVRSDFVEAARANDPASTLLPGTSSAASATAAASASINSPNASRGGAAAFPSAKEVATDKASLQNVATKSSIRITDSRVVGKDDESSASHIVPVESEQEKLSPITPKNAQETPKDVIRELESRVNELEKEIVCVNEKLNSKSLTALVNMDENAGGIGDLVSKIQAIQADMEKMNETASRLMDEKDNRETHTDALIEQIELLKTIKADKEDLEDALADKADAQAVNRKVSHDQFDATCDDLARGLEDAITKLGQQESIWQQALDEVQREIEGKLDKIEISPLKDFVNNRLKLLQEKLKALAEMRRESEAAGTKKMLSDVQCISCDSNVVMRMEEGAHYRAPAMSCPQSIKPYLTYELDQVRKQQRRLPNSRNMIQFEAAMQEMARKSKTLKDDLSTKSPRDHLCNRYCGGSHTITTPQQRVMRMGHFLTQWGPEVVQLNEGVIRGNDGQLYRSRAMPGTTSDKPDDFGPSDGDNEKTAVSPRTPSSPVLPETTVATQRHSQLSRRRSSISQASRRTSARKISDRIKETIEETTRIEEIPMRRSTPTLTIVDEAPTIPEPPGPTDEVVREVSLEEIHDHEEDDENPRELE